VIMTSKLIASFVAVTALLALGLEYNLPGRCRHA
jgi:hypothetical protein